MINITADALREAAEHHHAAEKRLPKHDWADWYAAYVRARTTPATVATSEAMADNYVLTHFRREACVEGMECP